MVKVNIHESEHHLRICVGGWGQLGVKLGVTFLLTIGCALFAAVAASSIGLLSSEEETSIVGFLVCCTLALLPIYCIAAIWINTTVLDISKNEIAVYRGPIYVPSPRRSIPTSTIEQLFVQEIRNATNAAYCSMPSYAVWALLQNGERVELVDLGEATGFAFGAKKTSLAERLEAGASLIEARIEEYLKIEDIPVQKQVRHRINDPNSDIGPTPSL